MIQVYGLIKRHTLFTGGGDHGLCETHHDPTVTRSTFQYEGRALSIGLGGGLTVGCSRWPNAAVWCASPAGLGDSVWRVLSFTDFVLRFGNMGRFGFVSRKVRHLGTFES